MEPGRLSIRSAAFHRTAWIVMKATALDGSALLSKARPSAGHLKRVGHGKSL